MNNPLVDNYVEQIQEFTGSVVEFKPFVKEIGERRVLAGVPDADMEPLVDEALLKFPELPVSGVRKQLKMAAPSNVLSFPGADGVLATSSGAVIYKEAGQKHEALEKCEAVLNGRIYNYASMLCVLANTSKEQGRILKRVKPSEIQTILSSLTTFKKTVMTENGPRDVTIDPPLDWCISLVEQSDWLHGIDRVRTLSTLPTMRPDGTVVTVPGYDKQTSILFDFAPGDFPAMLEKPCREDALAALARVRSYIDEFPFKTKEDEAATLGLLMTAVLRPTLRIAPGFALTAHTPGTGKTLVGRLAVILITGTGSTERPLPDNPEEQRKNVFANLLSARPYLYYDNLSGDFSSSALDILFTSDTFNDRVLSASETKDVSTITLVIFTGNNINATGDTIRRIVKISLDSGIESPTERTFRRHDVAGDVTRDRGKIVVDLLTIARAYVVAGKPDMHLTPCGFPEWSKSIRNPLVWLGVADPGAKLIASIKDDPAKTTLGQLLTTIKPLFKTDFHVSELIARIGTGIDSTHDNYAELRELLSEVAGGQVVAGVTQVSPKRLAGYFRRHEGRPASGLVIRKANGKTRLGVAWIISEVGV